MALLKDEERLKAEAGPGPQDQGAHGPGGHWHGQQPGSPWPGSSQPNLSTSYSSKSTAQGRGRRLPTMAVSSNPMLGTGLSQTHDPYLPAGTWQQPSVHLELLLQRGSWPGVPRPSASVRVGRAGPEDGLPASLRPGLKRRAWLPAAAGDWLSRKSVCLIFSVGPETGLRVSWAGPASVLKHHWGEAVNVRAFLPQRERPASSPASGWGSLLVRSRRLAPSAFWAALFLAWCCWRCCWVFARCSGEMPAEVAFSSDDGWLGSHVGILAVHGDGPEMCPLAFSLQPW